MSVRIRSATAADAACRNARALASYRKKGFAQVGEQIFQLGSDPQLDFVLPRGL